LTAPRPLRTPARALWQLALASGVLAGCRLQYEELNATPDDVLTGGSAGTSLGGVAGSGAAAGQASTGGTSTSGGANGGEPPIGDAGATSEGGSAGTSGEGAAGGSGECVSTGVERCDGVDNDCSGSADGAGVCPATCEGHVYNGHEYAFCSKAVDHVTAAASCEALGMLLVRIDDAAERDWLRGVCFAAVGVDNVSAVWPWIGASDEAVAGEWRWADGTQFWQGTQTGSPVAGLYANWAAGQPASKDSCAAMQNNPADSFWSAQPCTSPHPYTCERP
jgi:hypothetical protein